MYSNWRIDLDFLRGVRCPTVNGQEDVLVVGVDPPPDQTGVGPLVPELYVRNHQHAVVVLGVRLPGDVLVTLPHPGVI